MTDLIKRSIGHVIGALVSLASRLARVALARELIDSFTTAYDEASRLEAKGQPQLARYLRAELDDTLGTTLSAGPAPQPSLNGGDHDPFGLPRPSAAALSGPAGEGASPPRRRGRRPGTNGAQPAQEAPREEAAEPADPTTPIPSSNHQP